MAPLGLAGAGAEGHMPLVTSAAKDNGCRAAAKCQGRGQRVKGVPQSEGCDAMAWMLSWMGSRVG